MVIVLNESQSVKFEKAFIPLVLISVDILSCTKEVCSFLGFQKDILLIFCIMERGLDVWLNEQGDS